ALFLAAGGLATEPGRGSTLFTVALPVSRRRLLATHFGVVAGGVSVLAMGGAIASILGGAYVRVRYPILPALAGAFVQVVTTLPFAAFLLFLQTASRRAVTS